MMLPIPDLLSLDENSFSVLTSRLSKQLNGIVRNKKIENLIGMGGEDALSRVGQMAVLNFQLNSRNMVSTRNHPKISISDYFEYNILEYLPTCCDNMIVTCTLPDSSTDEYGKYIAFHQFEWTEMAGSLTIFSLPICRLFEDIPDLF